MKRAILGALVGAGLLWAVVVLVGWDRAEAQRLAPPAAGGDGSLIAVPTPMGEKGQLLTVIDPKQQTIGVYFVEGSTGRITLRSVRNIRWDLQMLDFNGANPLPREIRLQLEQR